MLTDLVVVLAMAAFGAVGWRRGTAAMLLTFLGLFAGYAGVALLAAPLSAPLARATGLPVMLAVPLAGAATFIVITMIARLTRWRLSRTRASRIAAGWEPPRADRSGGAALGAAWALGLALVIVWGAGALSTLTGRGASLPRSLTGRLAAALAGRASFAAARMTTRDPFLASVASAIVARPAETRAALGTLMGDARMQDVWSDPGLRAAILRGDTAAVGRHPSVRQLANDPGIVAAARQVGLLQGDAGGDALGPVLVERAGPTLRAVQAARDDPELRALLEDPAFKSRLETGDIGSLLTDPRFSRAADRILSALRNQPR